MSIRENFSDADMDQWLNENRVTEIECLVPDLTGVARGKILPRAKFTQERGMRIPEAVLGMTVTGNYPTEDAGYDRAISSTASGMRMPRSWVNFPRGRIFPRATPVRSGTRHSISVTCFSFSHRSISVSVSYTHLTLPTIYSV